MVRRGLARLGLGLAAAAGTLAAFNALVAWRRPPLAPPLDAEPRWLPTPQGRVCYYERGSGPTVLLLHSINAAASAYELRPLFERLARDHRVLAFDWLGFGLSDRPDMLYTPEQYQRLLSRIIDTLTVGPIDAVALSLPAQYLVAEAAAHPNHFRRLVLISPTGFGRFARRRNRATRPLLALFDLPVIGQAAFNALTLRITLGTFLRRLFADPGLLPEGYQRYAWQTSHQRGARHAPASFVAGLLDLPDAAGGYAALSTPTLLLFGDRPEFSDPEAAGAIAAANPYLHIEMISASGDLPQFEQPELTAARIRDFLAGSASATGQGVGATSGPEPN